MNTTRPAVRVSVRTVNVGRLGGLDGEVLSPSAGASVVFGGNEAGKSTWADAVCTVVAGPSQQAPRRQRFGAVDQRLEVTGELHAADRTGRVEHRFQVTTRSRRSAANQPIRWDGPAPIEVTLSADEYRGLYLVSAEDVFGADVMTRLMEVSGVSDAASRFDAGSAISTLALSARAAASSRAERSRSVRAVDADIAAALSNLARCEAEVSRFAELTREAEGLETSLRDARARVIANDAERVERERTAGRIEGELSALGDDTSAWARLAVSAPSLHRLLARRSEELEAPLDTVGGYSAAPPSAAQRPVEVVGSARRAVGRLGVPALAAWATAAAVLGALEATRPLGIAVAVMLLAYVAWARLGPRATGNPPRPTERTDSPTTAVEDARGAATSATSADEDLERLLHDVGVHPRDWGAAHDARLAEEVQRTRRRAELYGELDALASTAPNDVQSVVDEEAVEALSRRHAQVLVELDALRASTERVDLAQHVEDLRSERASLAAESLGAALAASALSAAVADHHDAGGGVLAVASGVLDELGGRWRAVRLGPAKTIEARSDDGRWLAGAALSTGARSLVYLAVRTALVELDTARQGVALPVIFDDPLVHLDPTGRLSAIAIIERLRARHQVIVFTCHPTLAGALADAGFIRHDL